MHHSHHLRRGRVSLIGQIYHVTFATAERKRLFDDFCLARAAVRLFGTLDASGETHSHAFMLMPDHVHWLFTLRNGDLGRLLARSKTLSSRDVRRVRPELDVVWQKDYYDHALRADEDLRVVGEYILANPVRAGLAAAPGDYPHWFADWL